VCVRKPLANGGLIEIEAKKLAGFPEPNQAQKKKSEPLLHLNGLKYISNVPQMDLKCTPSNFKGSRRFDSPV